MKRALRKDLPFHRLAIVVAGGGALGAYETGVLRALGKAEVRPAIVAGASAGALNAVCWVAAGFRTDALEAIWRQIEPATIGMRWNALAWRALGMFLVAFGIFELVLGLVGTTELSLANWLQPVGGTWGRGSAILDAMAWAAVAFAGLTIMRRSNESEPINARTVTWLQRLSSDKMVYVLVGWSFVHLVAWALGLPWP